MLVLSRKVGQKLVIDDSITVVVNRISGNRVSLAIEAPQDVPIVRGELKAVQDAFGKEDAAEQPTGVTILDLGPTVDHATSASPRYAR